jgi:hypothetical protein
MKRSTQELVMAIIFMLACLGFALVSFKYGYRARLVPLPVAIFSIAMVLIDLFFERVLGRRMAVDADEIFIKNKRSGDSCQPVKAERLDGHPEWMALLVVAMLLALVLIFGVIGGLFLYIFIFFKFFNRVSVIKAGVWAGAVTASVYVVFGLFLHVVFYKGILAALA